MSMFLSIDSYKGSHPFVYPKDMTNISSYIEARGGAYPQMMFFGLQMLLKNKFAQRQTLADLEEAKEVFALHGVPWDAVNMRRIIDVHGGYYPVRIRAVKEGTVMPVHNVMLSIESTDPYLPALGQNLETILMRGIWYPSTVASISWQARQIIWKALVESCDTPESEIDFRLHDFGARGVSSEESASIGGCAHLVNFMGTDTLEGVMAARRFYGAPMAGFSIPAAEHSTVTSWGRENETQAYEAMLDAFAKPGKILAVVSDSYDLMNAVENIWGDTLKEKLLASGARLVVRPDSGDPLVMPIDTIEMLGKVFGYTINNKGYKVLHPSVRVIQGDGITLESLPKILKNLLDAKWSAENLAFGMGGGLLQMVNRDTFKMAMKASAVERSGQWMDVYKDPITDPGKRSKRGRLALVRTNGVYETIREEDLNGRPNLLEVVWENGVLLREQSFDEIRALAKAA